MNPRTQVIKPLAWQLIELARGLLAESKELADLRAWLRIYPGRERPYLCDPSERAMLEAFCLLINRPVNRYHWQAFITHLEKRSGRRLVP